MTLLEYFIYEQGRDGLCPLTQLPSCCPKELGYAADADWCSYGANHDDCCRCWGREAKDPFIAVAVPNYTPINDRSGYCDLGGYRLKIEDGDAVGVYAPDELADDPAVQAR